MELRDREAISISAVAVSVTFTTRRCLPLRRSNEQAQRPTEVRGVVNVQRYYI